MADHGAAWRLRSRLTARQQRWFDRLSSLEPGLRLSEVAARLGEPYATVQRWASFFGYPIRDGRGDRLARVDWSRVNWRKSNVAIAGELGVTRERVRQVRAGNFKPSSKAARDARQAAGIGSSPRPRKTMELDWRLPNRDLAELYGVSVQHVANLRFRLGARPALWDARGGRSLTDRHYLAARKKEEQKARRKPSRNSKRATAGKS
jgi:hypothetical protein